MKMLSVLIIVSIGAIMFLLWSGRVASQPGTGKPEAEGMEIKLPPASQKGNVSLEETLAKRRSVRSYKPDALTAEQIGQLLWAANGLNADPKSRANRTVPSAGALYPMEVYCLTAEGFYLYLPASHSLRLIKKGDLRQALAKAALGQASVAGAPLVIVITGNYAKCAVKYKDRAPRYVHIEAGHIGQNIHLEAVALGLGSVPVGAFDDDKVKEILRLPEAETPLYIIPVGYPAK